VIRFAFVLLSFGIFLRPCGPARAQSGASFYPQQPIGVTNYTGTGILEVYGRGNESGEFSIKQAKGGTLWFFFGSPITINGSVVWCGVPPTASATPNPSDWPSNIVLGKTAVTVVYWKTTYGGESALVSNQIISGSGALPSPSPSP